MGTAQRIATAQRQINYSGVGLETDISHVDRPVTKHGISGIRMGTAGPGRQVQDNTYYLSLLRTKIAEIKAETEKHQNEIKQFHSDNAQYAKLERSYEAYIKEVRGLEGQLADYNLAMDKTRAGADPAELAHYHMMLKDKNDREKREVDAVFMQRKQKDEQIAKCEREMKELHAQAEAKIERMEPGKLSRYRELMKACESERMLVAKMQGELEQLNQQIRHHELELAQDTNRDEYHQLTKHAERLAVERDSLLEEKETCNMDPAQAREKLLSKVKADKQRIADLDRELESIEKRNANLRKRRNDLQQEIEDRKSSKGSNDAEKYETLFQRDQEMTQFIEKFEETKTKELETQRQTQDTIVQLLEHMSKDITRQDAMPSAERAVAMKEDLSFKEKSLQSSKTTQERLESELQKRQKELEKIDQLDKKISIELKSLTSKIESMKEQMVIFKDVDALRDASERTRRFLSDAKQQYQRRRDSVKKQVQLVHSAHDRLKSDLARNETAKTLEGLEQKLRHYEQNIFHLHEYIETKSRETDFRALKEDCGRLYDEINEFVIREADRTITMPAAGSSGY